MHSLLKRIFPWLLVIGLTLLSACGGGGSSTTFSSGSEKVELGRYPYGVENIVTTTDEDGDGHWDTRTTRSYQYNSNEGFVEVETATEYDTDADEVTDSLEVTVKTYQLSSVDPAVDWFKYPTSDPVTAENFVSSPSPGLLVSDIYASYQTNEAGTQYAFPSERHEYSYTYTSDGKVLETFREEWEYTPSSETLAFHSLETIRMAYNAAGDATSYSEELTKDRNGDGVDDFFKRFAQTYAINICKH